MQHANFAPGFRLSLTDVLMLVVGTIGALALGFITWWGGFVVGFVLAHFFLFCNVFRLARPLELAWSGAFVLLAVGTVALEFPGWIITASISLCISILVIVVEMRKPSYHGIGWRMINPGLPAWWESQEILTHPSAPVTNSPD